MATIIDVATRAGVSFKTVSRVLNGESYVSEATKEKVLLAAQDLNYQINRAAQTLRSKRPNLVALFINNPSRSYAQDVQIGVMAGCQAAGCTLIVEDPDKDGAIERLAAAGLMGAILTPPQSDDPDIMENLAAAHVPFIRIGTQSESPHGEPIGIDDRAAAQDMTAYLIQQGHSRIAFITGPSDQKLSQQRRQGYVDALMAAGLRVDEDIIAQGDFTYAAGQGYAEQWLTAAHPPTAIFASNDDMAAGCLAAAYKMNVRVPAQLSVAGFDDSPVARVISPQLTTVSQATREMSEAAVFRLDHIRRGSPPAAASRGLSHRLILRGSTGPA